MKKVLFTTLLLIVFFKLNGQFQPINFTCPYEKFFVNVEEPPKWIGEYKMIIYLNQFCRKELIDLKGANGKIVVGLIIYETGSICCSSFTNMTGTEISSEDMKRAFNEMPNWQPGKHYGKELIVLKYLIFELESGQFIRIVE
jgi:hypothetical protein